MRVVIQGDHQWDYLGGKYLNSAEFEISISDECNSEYVKIEMPWIVDVVFVKRDELKKALKILEAVA